MRAPGAVVDLEAGQRAFSPGIAADRSGRERRASPTGRHAGKIEPIRDA
jgi:hypothetical protein